MSETEESLLRARLRVVAVEGHLHEGRHEHARQVSSEAPSTAAPSPGLEQWADLSYSQIKRLATAYQQRKAALLGADTFRSWIAAPGQCEAFWMARPDATPC